MTIGFGFAEPIRDKTWILTASTKFSSAREKLRLASGAFLVAQDRQGNGCLHTNSFAGCKNMEHEVRNVRVRNRVGVSLLDCTRPTNSFAGRNVRNRVGVSLLDLSFKKV